MTKIEWTERTWNPIAGCSVVSPGCTNCYAMSFASRLLDKPGSHYEGTTKRVKGKPVWTGKIALAPESTLTLPLRVKKPTTWFVNSMSDLFHEDVPDEWIDRVFAVMALCPQHRFQVLTKRAKRMRTYVSNTVSGRRIWCITDFMADTAELQATALAAAWGGSSPWPLSNVWLGVSAEDQKRADERIPELLATPAAVRFVSAEPLLGAIDFEFIKTGWRRVQSSPCTVNALTGQRLDGHGEYDGIFEVGESNKLNWVIVGGESGPGARPMHPDWVRSIRDQCASSGTAFFFKQWGEWFARGQWEHSPELIFPDDECAEWLNSQKLRHLGGEIFHRIGKSRAGRLLDGLEHNAMPEDNCR